MAQAHDYRVVGASLFDSRCVHRLEKEIFPKDAFPTVEIAILMLLPRIVNLKVVAPDGALAGFASGSKSFYPRQPGWIITIGIATAHQRRGLGRLLLRCCEQRLGTKSVRLTVRASNTPAITLYENTGYTHIKRLKAYYPDGEDGLIMEKNLL